MVSTVCEFFRCHFGWKVCVIRLQYRTFKEKLKILGHHPFQLGFGFTTTCIMIVYENAMKSGTNKSSNGGQIIDYRNFATLFLNVHYHAEVNRSVVKCRIILILSAKQIS